MIDALNFKQLFTGVLVATSLLASLLLLGGVTHAQNATDAVCAGLGATVGGSGCSDPPGSSTIDGTVENVVNILSLVVAAISVIMIIIGGMKYVTSQGESGAISGAKNTIIYALVGLIIVALSQILVQFVLARTVDEGTTSTTTTTPRGTTTPINNGPR